MKDEKLVKILDEIKSVAQYVKAEHNGKITRLSNKDFNIWIITHLMQYESRLSKVEAHQKLMMWIIGISIAALGLYVRL